MGWGIKLSTAKRMCMSLATLQPRHAAAVGLLALIPLIVYGITDSVFAGGVSALNTCLIYGSLYLAMSPVETSHGHHGDGSGTLG